VGKAIPGNDKGDSTKITAFPVLGILLIATGNWDPDWFEIEPNHEERMPAASNVVLLGFAVKINDEKGNVIANFPLVNFPLFPINSVSTFLKLFTSVNRFFVKKWSIYGDEDNLYTNEDSSPFKAKIYVLTDSFCRSTCWNFVKELEQIPGVVHIGQQTAVQSVYSYAKQDRSPSEHFDVFYPTQIRVKPESKLGEALVPLHVYEGNLKDEAKVIDWVLSIIEKDISL